MAFIIYYSEQFKLAIIKPIRPFLILQLESLFQDPIGLQKRYNSLRFFEIYRSYSYFVRSIKADIFFQAPTYRRSHLFPKFVACVGHYLPHDEQCIAACLQMW
jgi:hypothetical protein